MSVLHGQVYAARPSAAVCPRAFPCTCCTSMSILHAYVHTARLCPYCTPMSILHAYVHTARLCPCCTYLSMLQVHVHALHTHVHPACPCMLSMLYSMSILLSISWTWNRTWKGIRTRTRRRARDKDTDIGIGIFLVSVYCRVIKVRVSRHRNYEIQRNYDVSNLGESKRTYAKIPVSIFEEVKNHLCGHPDSSHKYVLQFKKWAPTSLASKTETTQPSMNPSASVNMPRKMKLCGVFRLYISHPIQQIKGTVQRDF
jgi:hypothetical protein